jgi:hypothetical protein
MTSGFIVDPPWNGRRLVKRLRKSIAQFGVVGLLLFKFDPAKKVLVTSLNKDQLKALPEIKG